MKRLLLVVALVAALLLLPSYAQGDHMKKSAAPTNLRATVIDDPVNEGLTTGDDALVLVDGADTPITVKGNTLYTPHIADRVLVNKVDASVQIVQTLDLGLTPYGKRWRTTNASMPASGFDIEPVKWPTAGIMQNVTYASTTGLWTVTRSGTYSINGVVTMEVPTANYEVVIETTDGEQFRQAVPSESIITGWPSVTFSLMERMDVGDQISVYVQTLTENDSTDKIKGGKGYTNISVAHLAD